MVTLKTRYKPDGTVDYAEMVYDYWLTPAGEAVVYGGDVDMSKLYEEMDRKQKQLAEWHFSNQVHATDDPADGRGDVINDITGLTCEQGEMGVSMPTPAAAALWLLSGYGFWHLVQRVAAWAREE